MSFDPKFDDEERGGWRRYAVIAGVLLFFLGGTYEIYRMVNDGAAPKKRVAEIMALKLVPPPPPPPPKDEPPPPPKVVEQKIEPPPVDKPDDQPKSDPTPQAADLGASQGPCTANCVGTSGRDPTFQPPPPQTIGGGGGALNFGRYASLMQDQIGRQLRSDDKLNVAKFRATIRVWLTPAGKVDRVQVLRTTGDTRLDTQIEQVIGTMPVMPEAPPKEMPQPVIVRIGAVPGVG